MDIYDSFSGICLKIVGCSSNAVNLSIFYFMFTPLLKQSRSMFLGEKKNKNKNERIKKNKTQYHIIYYSLK